jgi:hypothetical protein
MIWGIVIARHLKKAVAISFSSHIDCSVLLAMTPVDRALTEQQLNVGD